MLWLKSKQKSLDWNAKPNEKKPETIRSRSVTGTYIWFRGGGAGKNGVLTAQCQIFTFSNAVSEEKSPSGLPRVHHLKYCELLRMDLNRGHTCFSCPRHWGMEKIWESCILYFVAGSLAVFGELQRTWSWKKQKTLFTVCALCVYGLCRLMQIFWNKMFRRDHTTNAGVEKLAFLVCSRCIVNFTVILIANISKYRLYIYLYI